MDSNSLKQIQERNVAILKELYPQPDKPEQDPFGHSSNINRDDIVEVEALIPKLASELAPDSANRNDLILTIASCFRVLRNACAVEKSRKIEVATFSATRDVVGSMLEAFNNIDNDALEQHPDMVCCRCAVQFLGNAITNNEQNKSQVLSEFARIFRLLLKAGDKKLSDYTCMALCMCFELWSTRDEDLFCDVITVLVHTQSNWALIIFGKMLAQGAPSVEVVLRKAEPDVREAVLEYIEENLTDDTESAKEVHPCHMSALCEQFKSDSHTILGLSQQDVSNLDAMSVSQLLSILCAATCKQEIYKDIIKDSKLLKTAVNMLHSMQMLGESGDNVFSNVTKLSHIQRDSSSLQQHPAYGLKSNLIRLIANMAHENRPNQDQVREMGGIQLIMNHTNIDGRNPYITQWAILAMRNLLRENLENQAVVSQLKLQGVANNLEALREFGVEAEMVDDKIVVKNVTDPALNEPSPFDKAEGRE